ncbi:HTH-type transcriptional regulator SutR [subsurface metagenome]
MSSQDLAKIVAANVRKNRKARGWSQEKLADKTGLHRTYIGAIERAEQSITLATLQRLAEALECSPQLLITQLD